MKRNGVSKRTSDMMFGKAKSELIIGDGNYVSIEEITKALQEALENEGEDAHIVDSKGETVNIEDVIKVVLEASDRIKVGEKNEKIENQDSRTWSTKPKEQEEKRRGAIFLGNNGLELPCGEYVSETDMLIAIEEYGIEVPEHIPPEQIPPEQEQVPPEQSEPPEQEQEPPEQGESPEQEQEPPEQDEPPEQEQEPPEQSEPPEQEQVPPEHGEPPEQEQEPPEQKEPPKEEPETHTVKKVVKLQQELINSIKGIILATAILTALSGITQKDIIENQQIGTTDPVVQTVETVNYAGQELMDIEPLIEEAIENEINSIEMGQDIHVNDGIDYYHDIYHDEHLTFGDEKSGGDYTITGFAIQYTDSNGETHKEYIENYDNSENQTNLGDFIDQFCEKYDISRDDAQILLHLGVDGQDRAGWVDINDLVNENTIPLDTITPSVVGDKFSGTSSIENGTAIIEINGQEVSIDVNSVKAGDKITINGIEYEFESLDITTEENEVSPGEPIYEDVVVGKKLNWSLKDCKLEIALLGAAVAGLIKLAQKIKNDKNKKNALFFEFESQEEMNEFLDKIFEGDEQEAKDSIAKMLKTWFVSEKQGIAQEFSEEQIQQLTEVVFKNTSPTYEFNQYEDSYMCTKDGKIVVLPGPGRENREPHQISQETREEASKIEGTEIRRDRLSEEGEELFENDKKTQNESGLLERWGKSLKGLYGKFRGMPSSKKKATVDRISNDLDDKEQQQSQEKQELEGSIEI